MHVNTKNQYTIQERSIKLLKKQDILPILILLHILHIYVQHDSTPVSFSGGPFEVDVLPNFSEHVAENIYEGVASLYYIFLI